MNTTRSRHATAMGMLVLANFLWALSYPITKTVMLLHGKLQPAAGSWLVTAMGVGPRFLLAAAILLVFAGPAVARATAAEWRQGVLIGLATALGMLWQSDGLQYTSASTSAFLTQFYSILIPAWVALRTRCRPPPRVWACCGLVLAGVGILARFDPRTFQLGRGETETLCGAFFFMGQILLLGQARYAGNRALPVTAIMFATEAVIFSALVFVLAPQPSAALEPLTSPAWLVGTLLLSVGCTLGAFLLMNTWQPLITPTEAGLIYCLIPVFTALLALFLPTIISRWAGVDYADERVTWHLLVGGALITVANLLMQWCPLGQKSSKDCTRQRGGIDCR